MAIKFSDLSNTSTLSSNDVFAVTDVDQNASVSITFGNLRNILVDANTFVQHANNITTALNNNANGTSLDADTLGGQAASYYLDYSNAANTPFIPTDLHDLTNSLENGGFVKFKADGSNSKLIFDKVENINGNNTLMSTLDITTNFVLEGTSNKYYTDDRVDTFFEENFGRYFNIYASTFDQGEVNDSYDDTVGYAPAVADGITDTIRIKTEGWIPGVSADVPRKSQAGRFSAFKKNKAVRIYGADPVSNTSISNQVSISNSSNPQDVAVGFLSVSDVSAANTTVIFPAVNFNTAQNKINIIGHGFPNQANTKVIYTTGGGDLPGSDIANNTVYHVGYVDADNFQLLHESNNAVVQLGSGSSGTAHTLTPLILNTLPYQRFTYTVAEWDLQTGQIASSTESVAVNLSCPSSTAAQDQSSFLNEDINAIKTAFNVENFVKLDFSFASSDDSGSGVTPGRGLCIYRSVGQVNTTEPSLQGITKLIAVLGPNDLENNSWIDYFTDDVLAYSGKNQDDNSYLPENTVHFKPLVTPTSSQRGWVDVEIDEVTYEFPESIATSEFIDVKLKQPIALDADEANGVWIAHNDTTAIQGAINANSNRGQKAVQLNPKQYVVSNLIIPNNFSVSGFAYSTRFKKLPWSGWGGSTAASKGGMFLTTSGSMQNVSLVGFDIDGNSTNQIAFDDRSSISKNYAIDCGQSSQNVLLDKIRLSNPIGGGIYVPDPTNLTILGCVVENGQITDRFVFNPLVADGGENSQISSNRFENFPNGTVNVSVTNKGVVEGNIISNCGSGLEVFASKFLITSPNVLTGPAGELLPQPDAYNSEYDLINIDLTSQSVQTGVGDFNSGPMRYQENGEDYDFELNPVTYRLFAIKKPSAGDESIWIEDLQPPSVGKYEEIVTAVLADANSTYIDDSDNSFTIANNGLTTGDPVIYTDGGGTFAPLGNGTEYFVRRADANTFSLYDTQANALNLASTSGVIAISGSDVSGASGTSHTFTRTKYLTIREGAESDNLKKDGGFQFTIPSESVRRLKIAGEQYTIDYMKNANNTIYHLDSLGVASSSAGDPDHIGIGWSASVSQYVKNGIIENGPAGSENPATWSAPYNDDGKTYADYTVLLKDYKYLTVGRKVRPTAVGATAHEGFSAGDPTQDPAPAQYGVIKAVTESEDLRQVTIKWENANKTVNATPSAVAGVGGTLEAENSFVIATGRIK